MKLLSVGLTGTIEEIRARLQRDCGSLVQDGFRITIDELSKGRYTFLGCNIIEGELSFRNYERIKKLLKHFVAKLLTDQILEREEINIIRKIIDRNYSYLSVEERNIVLETTLKILSNGGALLEDFSLSARHSQILNRILEYLDNHHELVLDGFITFRLKDYRDRLAQIVDKAVDEYTMDVEYKEFIRILRYFVDVQQPRIKEVHVVINANDTFKLLDTLGQPIPSQYLENFIVQNSEVINYEDILITALITIAPFNIMLHNLEAAKSPNLVDTIKNIFVGRVAICPGCDLCL
ncbi:putative sporulation protein YtxC [Sporolituus thermophilus]|uniref:Putative sporulation protein YtxC n=1 Tax=Sporolituus thermophilus DSM 23256 TaxID=1123285 RepID=A0A1G7JF46_9FIRM|nr:putative sporulation protein YtxC [Sporolituus thermophilus]SDF23531.1 putative sporulation protein YtxC [Sporolituus thermophilus DSM 23256]